jgi:hypothetical protein
MPLYDVDAYESAVENHKRALRSCQDLGIPTRDYEFRDSDVVHLFDIELATDMLYERLTNAI